MVHQDVSYWSSNLAHWHNIKSPLRPSIIDTAIFADLAKNSSLNNGCASTILMLGVTPEIASINWPSAATLIAVDNNLTMIKGLWQTNPRRIKQSAVINGDWLHLPLADSSIDLVIGDGSFNVQNSSDKYPIFNQEIKRVLKADGILILRHFIRPVVQESLHSIFSELRHGAIGNFHIFKWRLAMALQPSLASGVCLNSIWQTWDNAQINPETLAAELGWPIDEINTINHHAGKKLNFTFPTLQEIRLSAKPYFSEVSCNFPDYELGERCPIFLYQGL